MRCWTPPLGLAALVAGSAVALGALGCTADIPVFETDDPQKEVCGGTVCFTPEHVAVRKWGAGHVSVAAWRTGSCTLPRSGVAGEATVLDLDSAQGRLRLRVKARWSSGVSSELLLDVGDWSPCPGA